MSNEGLGAGMDNVHATRIGEACRQALAGPTGDDIDIGLRLVRLLREAGFVVRKRSPTAEAAS